jgi:polyhydroxyalkanoate synthase
MVSPFNMPDEFVQGFFKSGQSLLHAFTGMSSDVPASAGSAPVPALALAQAQAHYWQQQMALYMGMVASATGTTPAPTVQPEHGDRRFKADAWNDNAWYSLVKQTYLLTPAQRHGRSGGPR